MTPGAPPDRPPFVWAGAQVNDQVTINGLVTAASGSGQTASVTLKTPSGASLSIDSEDLYSGQSL